VEGVGGLTDMILNNISVPVNSINNPTTFYANTGIGDGQFPILSIGRGSYIVGLQIQSMVNFDWDSRRHNVHIGQFSSLATEITFMVDMNHDFASVTTSASSLVTNSDCPYKSPRKGQIIIQNDVWIGHGATIMSGVTIRNGAVIASNAHVVKDVPPYAIVGGNPAKVIKYRFTDEQITDLQAIGWWDWSDAIIAERKADFSLPIETFIDKYRCSKFLNAEIDRERPRALFFPDFDELYPFWECVTRAYCHDPIGQLFVYIPANEKKDMHIKQFESFLKTNYSGNGDIYVQVGQTESEEELFMQADHYITSRSHETVRRTCMADRYGVNILSCADMPIWRISE
jgi:virginiamycin A acetyltransferase